MAASARFSIAAGALALPALLGPFAAACAGGLTLRVLDRDGLAVPEVAVYLTPVGAGEQPAKPAQSASVNQHDMTFDPHLLVVESGTEVLFLNEDEVGHHVYSFSEAKQINLQVASQAVVAPVVFDKAGLVTLGCNIHDDMLAYILVVDTPYFAKTDASGLATVSGLSPGSYRLELWTPRLKARDLPDARLIEIVSGEPQALELVFEAKLRPPHRHSETSLSWKTY